MDGVARVRQSWVDVQWHTRIHMKGQCRSRCVPDGAVHEDGMAAEVVAVVGRRRVGRVPSSGRRVWGGA